MPASRTYPSWLWQSIPPLPRRFMRGPVATESSRVQMRAPPGRPRAPTREMGSRHVISEVSDDNRTGLAGQSLPSPLVVVATNPAGIPVPGELLPDKRYDSIRSDPALKI